MNTAEFGEAMAMSAIAREEAERALKNYFKWISVKDRLPDHSEKVLVAAKEPSGARQITVSMFTGNYFTMTGRRAFWKVTHWMPLPSVEGLNNDT